MFLTRLTIVTLGALVAITMASESPVDLCQAAQSFVSSASVHIDGIRRINGFPTEWIKTACVAGAGSSSINYSSDWIDIPATTKITSFIAGAGTTISSVSIQHMLTAVVKKTFKSPPQLNDDFFSVNATSSLRFTQEFTMPSGGVSQSVHIMATWKKGATAPLSGIGVSSDKWVGTLSGKVQGRLFISDKDLFDKAPAAVMWLDSSNAPTQQLVNVLMIAAGNVQQKLAEPMLNIAPGSAEPTSIPATIRACAY